LTNNGGMCGDIETRIGRYGKQEPRNLYLRTKDGRFGRKSERNRKSVNRTQGPQKGRGRTEVMVPEVRPKGNPKEGN